MPDAVAEPPVTTSSLPNKPSFLDDAGLNAEFEAALAKDGNLSPTSPKEKGIAPVTDKPPEKPAEKPPETKPAEKPSEKPPETKPEDDDTPTDIKSEAGKSSWKRLKESKKAIESERDTIRTERDALKGQIEELKRAATTPQQKANLAEDPEYITLKKAHEAKEKEANELSERLRLVEVEKHPKFEAYFKDKIEQQFAIAKSIGGDKLLDALKLPDGQYRKDKLNEIAAELDQVSISQLGSVLTRLTEIDAEKASEIAKARDSYTQLQNEQKASAEKQRAEMQALFKRVTDDVTSKDKGLSVFHERAGDEEWNKGVRERMSLAQAAYEGKLKGEDAMRMIYWGAAAPALIAHSKGLADKLADAEKTISELRAATPNPGGDSKGDPDPNPKSTKSGLDAMMESIEREGGFLVK